MARTDSSPFAVAAGAAVVVVGFLYFAGLEFPDNANTLLWAGVAAIVALLVLVICAVIGGPPPSAKCDPPTLKLPETVDWPEPPKAA